MAILPQSEQTANSHSSFISILRNQSSCPELSTIDCNPVVRPDILDLNLVLARSGFGASPSNVPEDHVGDAMEVDSWIQLH